MKIKLNVRVNLTSQANCFPYGQNFTLKPNQQKVVRLLIDEIPYKKMAAVIGCKENTVKTQVCRVRQVLKEAI